MKRLLLVFLSVLSLVALVGCAQGQNTSETGTPSLQGEVTLVAPSDGITLVSRTPSFSWTSSVEASSYTIQVSVERSFGMPVIDEEVTGTSYTIPSGKLTHDKTYFWRVKATKGGKSTAWSKIWIFRTVFLG
jgi:hypothetical protein